MPFVETPSSLCMAGVARDDITPPVGIYHRLWGAATHERATGVHRPITATALCLAPDPLAASEDAPLKAPDGATADVQSPLVFLALDHCLFWSREMELVLTRVAEGTGIAKSAIVTLFSHTHAAGLMGFERESLPGGDLIRPYLENLATKLNDLIVAAKKEMVLAEIGYGIGHSNMAAQRDFWDEEGRSFVCGFNPGGQADETVMVARISKRTRSRRGKPKLLATVVNYACHPTTLAWDNTLISPDYPGATREVIEKATKAPCFFIQGASGDLGPREGFVGDPEVADRNGRQLGYAALAALESLPAAATRFSYEGAVVSGATIGVWSRSPLEKEELASKRIWSLRRVAIELGYRSDMASREVTLAERADWQARETAANAIGDAGAARDCHAQVERRTRHLTRLDMLPPGKRFPLDVTILRLGDAVWLALEGEHYQWLQQTLRARFPQVPLILGTLANGSRCSYLPTRETYGKGIYQESIALLAPGSLEELEESLEREIERSLAVGTPVSSARS